MLAGIVALSPPPCAGVPKALDQAYLAEDFALFDFTLSDADMYSLGNATSPPQTGTPPQQPDDDQDCATP